jgi:hypothetical protein
MASVGGEYVMISIISRPAALAISAIVLAGGVTVAAPTAVSASTTRPTVAVSAGTLPMGWSCVLEHLPAVVAKPLIHELGEKGFKTAVIKVVSLLDAGSLVAAEEYVAAVEGVGLVVVIADFTYDWFDFWFDCVAPLLPNPGVTEPTMSTSPSSGTLGDKFTISGQDWAPGGTLRITLPYGSKGWFVGGPWTLKVPANGSWEISATVSQQATAGSTLTSPPGVYVFTATENPIKETASYTVLPNPSASNPSPSPSPTFVCLTGGNCSP